MWGGRRLYSHLRQGRKVQGGSSDHILTGTVVQRELWQIHLNTHKLGFPEDSVVKNPLANAGDVGLILESQWFPGMATHSSILTWEITWKRSLACSSPWGCKRVPYNLVTKQQHTSSSTSGMPRNAGKDSECHMIIWQKGFVHFFCPQKSQYLGSFKYFVHIS